MEFVSEDLSKSINDTSEYDLSLDFLIVIMFNVLNAVRFLHSVGVMHRDLKPANILLNDECLVKICDFGLSRCEIVQRNT